MPAAAPESVSPLSATYRVATVGILATVTLIAFEAMAVATAMPVVAHDLGGLREYALAFSLFMTTSLFGIVLAGSWCDARGPRGPVLTGLALFGGGLVGCGLAQAYPQLLVGRAVSGAGGGLLVVSLYVVVARVFPADLQPRVFGYLSAAWVLPSVVGPPLAGWLATSLSWRAVFLLVAPMVVVLGVLLLSRMPRGDGRGTSAGREDGEAVQPGSTSRVLAGLVTAGGAFALQYGLQGAGRLPGWIIAAAGLVAVVVAVPRLLPAGTLRLRRGLPSVVAVRSVYAGSFFAAEAFVPLMLVEQRHLSPTLAGVTLTGGALGWAAGSWLQGRPGLRVDHFTLLWSGLGVVAVAVAALVPSPLPGLPSVYVWPAWVLGGFGMGLGMSSTSVLTLRLSVVGEEGRNSSGLQVSDSLGAVLVLGVAGAVFARLHDPADGSTAVYSLIWACLAAFAAVGVLVARRARPHAS